MLDATQSLLQETSTLKIPQQLGRKLALIEISKFKKATLTENYFTNASKWDASIPAQEEVDALSTSTAIDSGEVQSARLSTLTRHTGVVFLIREL